MENRTYDNCFERWKECVEDVGSVVLDGINDGVLEGVTGSCHLSVLGFRQNFIGEILHSAAVRALETAAMRSAVAFLSCALVVAQVWPVVFLKSFISVGIQYCARLLTEDGTN